MNLNDRQGDVQLDAASGSFAGLTLNLTDFTDAQADAAVGRITHRNFRLIHGYFAQIQVTMRIKGPHLQHQRPCARTLK